MALLSAAFAASGHAGPGAAAPASGAAAPPPVTTSRPPAVTSRPPAVNTAPPLVNTPPPSGATPPPAVNTPPPAVNTPPPGMAFSQGQGSLVTPPAGNNQNIQPGVNQSVQSQFRRGLGSPYYNQSSIPTNGVGMYNNYNGGNYAPGGLTNTAIGTNNLPPWRRPRLPAPNYPPNLPVQPR
jgi:hypothetical protein